MFGPNLVASSRSLNDGRVALTRYHQRTMHIVRYTANVVLPGDTMLVGVRNQIQKMSLREKRGTGPFRSRQSYFETCFNQVKVLQLSTVPLPFAGQTLISDNLFFASSESS
jgi:hypothetical protein